MSALRTTSDVAGDQPRRHEVLGILCAGVTALIGLALFSYDAQGGENLIGPVGNAVAGLLATAFGIAAWLVPLELAMTTLRLFRRTRALATPAALASTLVLTLVGCAMLHLGMPGHGVFGGHLAGGVLGEVLGEVLRSLLGLAGSFVVGTAILLATLVLRTSLSIVSAAQRLSTATKTAATSTLGGTKALVDAWREAKALEQEQITADLENEAPKIITLHGLEDTVLGLDDEKPKRKARKKKDKVDDEEEDVADDEIEAVDALPLPLAIAIPRPSAAESDPRVSRARKAELAEPRIVAPIVKPPPLPAARDVVPEPDVAVQREFVLPPTMLLEEAHATEIAIDESTLRDNAVRLVEKLEAYGVKGRVDEIHPGPVVTMYEFEPQSGTKVSKIAGLADDLAMALAAQKVRIVAPIPGKARVGFELPNEVRQTVKLREVLEDDRWQKMKGAALPVAFGKDIAGQPVYGDLSKMPHLLVAGATGAGKSVGLNVLLVSLLLRKTPEQVRLLMIDPKVVELAVFDGIPHMLLPVVTDMKKASLALRWAVDEMERRYQMFADAGARNIATYNERVQKVLDGEMPAYKLAPSRIGKVKAQGMNGQEMLLDPDEGEVPNAVDENPTKLPYVVVVVDEFADLMMVAAKDVEAAIARLAQKARAAGIHVILATQRPSVDVITGMIKANFPARIAFKVSQREDSKTILGRSGAEHLLGMGDMLMIPPGASDLKRVHSAFISEDEVKSVCDFLRAQGKPVYDEDIIKPRDDEGEDGFSGASGADGSDDPMYDKAVAVVANAGYCSISHIQRQLGVGYNKAAKLVERMEKEGVVGPASAKAGGRREVLVQGYS